MTSSREAISPITVATCFLVNLPFAAGLSALPLLSGLSDLSDLAASVLSAGLLLDLSASCLSLFGGLAGGFLASCFGFAAGFCSALGSSGLSVGGIFVGGGACFFSASAGFFSA